MYNNVKTKKVKVATWSGLEEKKPSYALVADVDLVVIRYGNDVSVLYGRCLHRGALMADGFIDGQNLLCGVHGWDYRYDTGISEYNNDETLHKFSAWIDRKADAVYVDEAEVIQWSRANPQPWHRDSYQGLYADMKGGPEEPFNRYIHHLASTAPSVFSSHGPVSAMGIPLTELPRWEDIQVLTAQLSRSPLLEEAHVGTNLVVGPNAKKPLELSIPLFVSDMSIGALGKETKIALSRGAELSGTGICSGEGGMLEAEQAENSHYFYELAPGKFGWDIEQVTRCQAFHFKAGQAAKTGVGGMLPAGKVSDEIAKVRRLAPHTDAKSPSRFKELVTPEDFRRVAEEVREATGGIPVGFKMSAQHIEDDIDFALEVGVDYIILDGRGGGTGASPDLLKNNIAIPTIPALARARKHLDKRTAGHVTLVITGGLRIESHFIKALALGADGIAIANAAIQAVGCLGMRACHNNHCPVGVATQNQKLRERIVIDESAKRLHNYLQNSVSMMKVMARACGYNHLRKFNPDDLVAWKQDVASLAGIRYGGAAGKD